MRTQRNMMMTGPAKMITGLLLFVPILGIIAGCTPKKEEQRLQAGEKRVDTALMGRLHGQWTGDLDEILRSRRVIRVLVSYGKTDFEIVNGHPQGFEYELFHEYEHSLDEKVRRPGVRMPLLIFITVPTDQLIPLLLDGRGDIAASLKITPQREKLVAFTEPYILNVNEVVVTGKAVRGLHTLADLSGRTVNVVSGSSYAEHLRELNKRLRKRGRKAVRIVEVETPLEQEDILEMVNSGIFEITVVDSYIAELWSRVLPDIAVREDIVLKSGGNIGWAVRRENPELLASLNGFISAKGRQGNMLGNMLFARYYENTRWILNPITRSGERKLIRLKAYFRKYAKIYDFDWLRIAATAYQESHLKQGYIRISQSHNIQILKAIRLLSRLNGM
jgi:membrane-bound lytic murein transglycosylase MltF